LASAALLLLAGFALSLAIPAVRDAVGAVFERILLIASIQQNPADAVQETERLTMYLEGWNAFIAHPVLGIGYQSLAQLTLARDGNEVSSHNLLLTLIAEAGWPAFAIFVGLMAAYFRRLNKGVSGNVTETDRDVLTAMRLSMIGLLVGSMFHQLIAFHLFYALLGAAFGLSVRKTLRNGPQRASRRLLLHPPGLES
jgi:O-antigen ligase